MSPHLGRRSFLGLSVAATGGLVFLGFEPARAEELPTGFPSGVPVGREVFRNWDQSIVSAPLWTAVARSSGDVVKLANWARTAGYRLRARGYQHSWSPLTVSAGATAADKVLLVDTTQHLTGVVAVSGHRVTVRAGTSMQDLLSVLAQHGLGLESAPAPGGITVGGALAIDGHGTSIRKANATKRAYASHGTVSNLVLSLKAVVWDQSSGAYVERTFDRSHQDCAAFLTNLGRAFLTEVTLMAAADEKWRCRNITHIKADVLFAAPAKAGQDSLSAMLDRIGRVGIIWYAFTDRPWIQWWETAPTRPFTSRPSTAPYNYLFADNLPTPVPQLLGEIVEGAYATGPAFCNAIMAATDVGLTATLARDMWGPSKNFIHFVKATTLRVTAGSHAVVVERGQVQQVVHQFTTFYRAQLKKYADRGDFPINSGLEIRVTSVDNPADTGVSGAQAPALSAAAPVEGHPERDTVVWLDVLTLPETPGNPEFYEELEAYLRGWSSDWCTVRPEWAKRWAHAGGKAWASSEALQAAKDALPRWEWAVERLNAYDPDGLFVAPTHEFLGLA